MSSLLLDGLDKVGIIYTFKSATDVYKSGILDDVIDQILEQSQILGEHISSIVGQKKYLIRRFREKSLKYLILIKKEKN